MGAHLRWRRSVLDEAVTVPPGEIDATLALRPTRFCAHDRRRRRADGGWRPAPAREPPQVQREREGGKEREKRGERGRERKREAKGKERQKDGRREGDTERRKRETERQKEKERKERE